MSRLEKKRRPLGAEPGGPVFAAIDAGSHTIRLLVATLGENLEITPLKTERRITCLARGFREGRTLKEAGMSGSLAVFREYAAILEDYGAGPAACGATGVIRKAVNGKEFLERVHEETGIRARILSEEAEAILSTRGVLSVLPSREGAVLTFDLGGSSTEFTLVDTARDEPLWNTSVFIGAATVTERWLLDDPPGSPACAAAARDIREALAPALATVHELLREAPESRPFRVVGTAGTATTLAAMRLGMAEYRPFLVNGSALSTAWLDETIALLSRSTLEARRGIRGLEKGREDIILGGGMIVRAILEGLGLDGLTVVDGGLLEGLLIDEIESRCGLPHSLKTPLTWRRQGI
ncbi:MAG: hypothetical protein LLF99_02595 [Desulfobacteraceae bacterium]|nr:hypothetical protein [Desulfobacteraceae bacterium]